MSPSMLPPSAAPVAPPGWKEKRLAKCATHRRDIEQLALSLGAVVAAAFPTVPGEHVDHLTASLQRVLTSAVDDYAELLQEAPSEQDEAERARVNMRYLGNLIDQRDSLTRQLDHFERVVGDKVKSQGEGFREVIGQIMEIFEPLFVEPLRRQLQGLNEQIQDMQPIVDAATATLNIDPLEPSGPLYPPTPISDGQAAAAMGAAEEESEEMEADIDQAEKIAEVENEAAGEAAAPQEPATD